jgi:FixJ family two-component response regulator
LPTTPPLIAIVDDEPSVLRALQRLLDGYKLKTETFESAEAFLERDHIDDVSCIVLDINLRGMSGIEMRRRLAAEGSATPVIFMTALDSPAVHQEAIGVGFAAYLHKPVSGQELIGAIQHAIQGS